VHYRRPLAPVQAAATGGLRKIDQSRRSLNVERLGGSIPAHSFSGPRRNATLNGSHPLGDFPSIVV
jgi:hypothetical protein